MKARAVAREAAAAAGGAGLGVRETAAALESFAGLLAVHPDLAEVLGHPALKSADLRALALEALPGLGELGLACVEGLAVSRGLKHLARVAEELTALADAREGVVHARVASARGLTAGESQDLGSGLALALGRKVRMTMTVRPALLGGVRVEAAGKVFEGSMKGQLEAIRKELRAA